MQDIDEMEVIRLDFAEDVSDDGIGDVSILSKTTVV
jgi:predicted DNA-binding protein (UPF0251 family)